MSHRLKLLQIQKLNVEQAENSLLPNFLGMFPFGLYLGNFPFLYASSSAVSAWYWRVKNQSGLFLNALVSIIVNMFNAGRSETV